MGGRGIQAGAIARRPPLRAGRGNGGNGGNGDDDDGPPSDGGGDGRHPGASVPRTNARGKAAGTTTTAKAAKTKAASTKAATAKKSAKAKGTNSVQEEVVSHPGGFYSMPVPGVIPWC